MRAEATARRRARTTSAVRLLLLLLRRGISPMLVSVEKTLVRTWLLLAVVDKYAVTIGARAQEGAGSEEARGGVGDDYKRKHLNYNCSLQNRNRIKYRGNHYLINIRLFQEYAFWRVIAHRLSPQ